MARVTLIQIRANLGRLLAAGVAIIIATAFVTATVLSTGVLERSAYNAVLSAYPNTDVIVTGDAITADVLDNVRATPGVTGADGRTMTSLALAGNGRSDHQRVASIPQTSALRLELERGTYPDGTGGVVIAQPVAERLSVDVGSTVDVEHHVRTRDDTWDLRVETVAVTGVFADPGAAFAENLPTTFAHPADLGRWAGGSADGAPTHQMVLVVADSGVSAEELRDTLEPVLRDAGGTVQAADEYAKDITANFTSGTYIFTTVLMGFAVVALFAAGMVISNTFAVLVAQRRHQLALLRCVGATRRQIYRTVLAEATALGVAASVAGIGAGIALAQGAVTVLGWMSDAAWVPSAVAVPVTAVVIPLLAGTVVTVAAALSPARVATRVAPLAALRPPSPPGFRAAVSARRIATAVALVVIGGVMLAGGVAGALAGGPVAIALAVGMLGGAVSFIGVVVGAVAIVPPVVSTAGRALARMGGVPARLAAVNAVRHPRRTASTASALLIGVTLVAMVSVGAASAQATMDGELDQRYPVDVAVGTQPAPPGLGSASDLTELDPVTMDAVAGVDGVARALPIRSARVTADAGEPGGTDVGVYGLEPATAREIVRTASDLEGLGRGTALIPASVASFLALTDGDRLQLTAGERSRSFSVVVTSFPERAILLADAGLAELVPDAPVGKMWLELSAAADPGEVVRDLEYAVSQASSSTASAEESASAGPSAPVTGHAAERAEIGNVVDTMLAVVTGLLAVAVVIAVIGVGNTLSLSVIERSRESATLRALGLTRRQLRGMLAAEGVLIAGSGAVLGIGLGLAYGWIGTVTTLGGVWDTHLAMPWSRLGLIAVISVVAGLLASALPARRAARSSPVAALAAD